MPKRKSIEDMLFENGLPADKWTEQVVLGACIRMNRDTFDKFAVLEGQISETDFTTEANRRIFAAFRNLHDTKREIDYAAVLSDLVDHKNLEAVGGVGYLNELDSLSLGTEYQPRHYFESCCRQLRKKSLSRDLVRLFNHGMGRCANNENSEEVLPDFMDRLRGLSLEYSKQERSSTASILESEGGLERFVMSKSEEIRTWTPWMELNNMTSGLQAGRVWILAALTSCGKTTLALQLLANAVMRGRIGIYFSLEMPAVDLIRSMVSAKSGVHSQAIEHGRYSEAEYESVKEATKAISSWPIQWESFTGTDPAKVRLKVETAMTRGQVGLVVVDYLQLMGGGGGRKWDNKHAEISHISRQLKIMAGEFGVPFLVLSQLNREPARTRREPQLSDLRESGSIEQDADVVMFLHRPDAEDRERTKLIVAKNRTGPCGEFEIEFELPYRRFKEG